MPPAWDLWDMLPSLYERMRKADRRRHARFATAFKAELILDTGSKVAIVGDISAGGAMLEADDDLWQGRKIWLKAKQLNVHGVIRWTDGGVCGVAFATPVDPLAVIAANAGSMKEPVTAEPVVSQNNSPLP